MRTPHLDASAAGTWTLGDLTVNRLGFGSMRITADPDRERAIRVVRRAVELGVDHVDTAAFYFSPGGILQVGDGPTRYATELLREALAPHVLAIPGTGDPDHVVDNVAAAGLRLTADELAALG